ncbi:MAG: hypothetical protein JRH20_16405 [Deltaproteobacteria bacterium]|nr:hypothetical protein [Deltaproteobacteria bacterium]
MRPSPKISIALTSTLWLAVTITLAATRIPFDDEWFSITLARLPNSHDFWQSLRSDLHPPLVALIDRALLSLLQTTHWFPLQLLRISASLAALLLLFSILRRHLQNSAPTLLLFIGAFHPIVLFYGGAIRWYPYLFLAQALRWWAIFGPTNTNATPHSHHKRQAALCTGAALGPAVGYIDMPLLALDLIFFWRIHRARHGMRLAFLAGLFGVASLLTSASLLGHLSLKCSQRSTGPRQPDNLVWFRLSG